jgi:type II secretory pathway component PulK
MLMAIVAIGVAAAIFLALFRQSFLERSALRVEAWEAQAAWLVESGLERAAARLADDPEYRGETWRIPAEAFEGKDAAVVQIEVEGAADQAGRRSVRVRADYPDAPQHRARKSKQLTVEVRSSSPE